MGDMIDLNKHAAEGHDPMCPCADMEQAWNGADCACAVIRVLRSVEGVTLQTPGDYLLERITEEVSAAHDSRCPQSDPDSSSDCHCALLARRSKWGTDSLTLREAVDAGIVLEHDPLCPPGLKATTPDRCPSCGMIGQARSDERLRILKELYRIPRTDAAPWIHVDDVLRIVGEEGTR